MTLACPGCGGSLLVSGDLATPEVTLELTTDAREHLARCMSLPEDYTAAPTERPLWMRCSKTACTWRSEFASPAHDWDGYVVGVSEGATHMRTVHNDEPAAQQIERWLLDQARQAGRAVEGHRA